MKVALLVSLLFSLSIFSCFSQSMLSLEFLKDTTPKGRQYIKLIFHADSLYKSRDFQKAIATYDEAYQLKPKEQYPRFKAEDIRTLYLKNDIAKVEQKQGVPTEYGFAKRHREKLENEEKKKLIAEGKVVPEKVKENKVVASNEKKEVKKEVVKVEAKQEIKIEQKKEPVVVEVKKEPEIKIEKQEIITPEIDEKTKKENEDKLKTYEKLKAQEEAEEKQKIENQEKAKKEIEANVNVAETPKKDKEIVTISDIIVKKSKDEEQKRIMANVSSGIEMKPEDEQKILAAKYPKEKTIETITEKTKTTTQVVINQNGIVTIFLKVVHNWGQTFYFVKEPTSQVKSIGRDYFERFTR